MDIGGESRRAIGALASLIAHQAWLSQLDEQHHLYKFTKSCGINTFIYLLT